MSVMVRRRMQRLTAVEGVRLSSSLFEFDDSEQLTIGIRMVLTSAAVKSIIE